MAKSNEISNLDGKSFYKLFKEILSGPYNDGINIGLVPNMSPKELSTNEGMYQGLLNVTIFIIGYSCGDMNSMDNRFKTLNDLSKIAQAYKNTSNNINLRKRCYRFGKQLIMEYC